MIVLDSSALLAWLFQELGHEQVDVMLEQSSISAVNWSEVWQKSLALGLDTTDLTEQIQALKVTIEPFNAQAAELAASLWPQTRTAGLSLGDRACLALGWHWRVPVYTADRVWATLVLPDEIQIVLIREPAHRD